MRVLGLDTATRATTVAVWDTETGYLRELRDDPEPDRRPRHTSMLLTLAQRALSTAGSDWAGIDLVAVGVGPGTFTGIRIGVSTARALAVARGVPIVGVSTLRAVCSRAAGVVRDGQQTIAVLDARRGEVFAGAWSDGTARDPEAAPLLPPRALAPEQLAHELAQSGGSWLAVGDGAVAFRGVLHGPAIEVPDDQSDLHRVTAVEICRLGLTLAPASPDQIHPDYLRLPDAELNLRAREARQSPS